MIEVENLTKAFGKKIVLNGVSLRAAPGTTTILTGDNGTGKTTLLRILAGLARPSAGTARIAECDLIRSRREAQSHLAFLPQALTFHPGMTPDGLLRFYAGLRRILVSGDQITSLLRRFHLEHDRRKPVRQLSGGMRQRLGLALLLLPDADVLLLDEPAISLDPGWRRRLADVFRDETSRGKTVFLTTHLPSEWEGEADVHLVCRDGKITPQAETPDREHSSSATVCD